MFECCTSFSFDYFEEQKELLQPFFPSSSILYLKWNKLVYFSCLQNALKIAVSSSSIVSDNWISKQRRLIFQIF
jgi:hypothetical protein